MITIHHLGVSQSDRVVWLMEELGLPYTLKWYHRGPDRLAPPEFLALHPTATAPVIEDDGVVLAESIVILEHICRRHAGGRLTVNPDDPRYSDYLFWMQFNNNLLGLYFAHLALAAGGGEGPGVDRVAGLIARRRDSLLAHMDECLGKRPYLAGDELTCADIMAMFNLTTLPHFGGQEISGLPNLTAYSQRITARPAYAKAMEIAGPNATPK